MFVSNRLGSPYGLALGVMTVLLSALGLLTPASAQQNARLALPNSVLPVITRATRLQHFQATQPLHVTVCLKFPHPDQAQAYADAVSNPASPLFRQFLTPEEIGERFGPAQADYDAVASYLKASGLTITKTTVNRMTVSATGTVAQIEGAFGTTLNVYRESELDRFHRAGRLAPALTFFANATSVQLPANLVPAVRGVAGLHNYITLTPTLSKSKQHRAASPYGPATIRVAYDLAPLYNGGYTGTGRTLGITNFDGVNLTDAGDFVTNFDLPTPLSSGAPTNVTVVSVDGGVITGSPNTEGDVDVQMMLGYAPLANIRIYAGYYTTSGSDLNVTDADYIDVLAAEVSDNAADLLSESYAGALTESDLVLAHDQHLMMTMQGQTYHCASGDDGSGLYSDQGYYPDIDSEVLVVGGTFLNVNAANQISSEVAWSGSGGGFYADPIATPQPAWQTGRGVPVSMYRVFPDVALHAGTNSSAGAYVFFAGGGPIYGVSGTSFASPIVCASLGIVEQYLIAQGALPANSAGKQRLGRVNDAFYAMNGRNDVWHDITSGNNGGYACTPFWDYVTGWGSFDFNNLAAALLAPLAVAVTPQQPTVPVGDTLQLTATVTGSNVKTVTWAVTSGPGSVSSSGLYTAPASVASTTLAVVTATSTINTATPVTGSTTIIIPGPPVSISGTITLQGAINRAQNVVFQLQSSTSDAILIQNVTLAADGSYTLSSVPADTYNIAIKGSKWLQSVVLNVNATANATGVNATLLPGDIDNNNVVDLRDFNLLAEAFGSTPSSANWNANADLDCNNVVDLRDFNLLATNFGKTGQTLP